MLASVGQESRQFLTLVDDVCEDEHSEEINRLFKCLDRDSSSSSDSPSPDKGNKKKKTKKAGLFGFISFGLGQEKKTKDKKLKKEKRMVRIAMGSHQCLTRRKRLPSG